MKKKLLIIGIIMNSAGTEKSFLSFASALDYDRFDVDLLLAKKQGAFMELIPPQINVLEMPEYGEFFLLSGKNAFGNIWNTFIKRKPSTFFEVLPYFLKLIAVPKKRTETAIKLWIRMLRHFTPVTAEYDAAVAYWGDRAVFYMVDKVLNAKRKIAWMHFDYDTPPRDDTIYGHYFSKCDAVVNVSEAVDSALRKKLPAVAGKCSVIENILDAQAIRRMALDGPTFPDPAFKGTRILTVGRISEQKGVDFIPIIVANLVKQRYNVRWYIVGDGDEAEKGRLADMILKLDLSEHIILLGTTLNPYTYMRDCTIYCQPSRYEGKPIAVEEAKIMRCPIVAANYLSAAEQLDSGRYGVIADIAAEPLFDAIKSLVDEPILRDNLVRTLHNELNGNADEIEKFYKLLE